MRGQIKMSRKVKYLTKEQLIKLNNKSIILDRNRNINPKVIENLPKYNKVGSEKVFPIIFSMVHNDVEMRCMIQFDETAENKGLLDISCTDYNKLPVHTFVK
tara:strand:- start:509 stop:814 length:306 start_codon:yes stop_codon:yes gene_type:complete